MGQVWSQGADGVWVPGIPAVRNTTGWVPGRNVFRKSNSTTWALVWTNDTTPPGAPTITSITNDTADKKLALTVKAPSDSDTKLIRMKISTVAFPTSPTTQDSGYIPSWAGATMAVGGSNALQPGGSVNVLYPSGMTTTYKTGVTYYVSAWAQDASYNWSPRATASLKIPIPTAPTSGTVTKSAYVYPTDSASWNNQSNYWRSDNNYVYQGGYDWMGCWFYGTKIQSLLAKAKKITAMHIQIQRANTAHGVSTGAEVWLGAHHLLSQPSGQPTIYGPANIGTLTRGQQNSFNVPSVHWPYFISGSNKGLGLHYGTTAFTDPKYMYAYGAGTGSGRIYLEWTE